MTRIQDIAAFNEVREAGVRDRGLVQGQLVELLQRGEVPQ